MSPMFDNFYYFFNSNHKWQFSPGFINTIVYTIESISKDILVQQCCVFGVFLLCWANWDAKKYRFFGTVPLEIHTGSVVPLFSWFCFDYYQHKQHWIIFNLTCKQCIIFSIQFCMHIFDKRLHNVSYIIYW